MSSVFSFPFGTIKGFRPCKRTKASFRVTTFFYSPLTRTASAGIFRCANPKRPLPLRANVRNTSQPTKHSAIRCEAQRCIHGRRVMHLSAAGRSLYAPVCRYLFLSQPYGAPQIALRTSPTRSVYEIMTIIDRNGQFVNNASLLYLCFLTHSCAFHFFQQRAFLRLFHFLGSRNRHLCRCFLKCPFSNAL